MAYPGGGGGGEMPGSKKQRGRGEEFPPLAARNVRTTAVSLEC